MSARSRRAKRRLAFAIALAWLAAPAFAQNPPAPANPPAAAPAPGEVGPPAPPPAPPAGPTAIATSDVAAQLEPARVQLAQMRDLVAPEPVVLEIEKELLAAEQPFKERIQKAAADLQGELSLDAIDDLETRADVADKRLRDWQATLSSRSQVLGQSRDTLQKLRDTWSLTLDQAKAQNAPQELIDNVKQLRTEMRDVDKQLDDRFDAVLKLQALVAEQSLAVSVLTQDIRRARYEVRGRLLDRNRRPLTAVIASVETVEPVLTRLRDGITRDAQNVMAFASLGGGGPRLVAQGLLFLAFLAMAIRMRRWVAMRKREGKALGDSEAVFDHPVSTALLLAVIATPLLHPYAPRALLSFLGALTIVPMMILLPQVLAPKHRSVWFALAAVFMVDRIRYFFQPVEVVERTLLFLATAISLGLAIHLLRGERFADLVAPRYRDAMRAALRVSAAALGLSIAANLAGYENLADLLGLGAVRSAWAGAALYAAVGIARPVLGAVLRSRAARTSQTIQRRRRAIEEWGSWAIGVGAGLYWAVRTLAGFELAEPLERALSWVVTTPIPIGDVSFSLGDVLLFLTTAGAGIGVARIVAALLEEDVLPRARLARGVPQAITATVRYAILLAGFLLAAAAAGFQWNRITLLAGAFGVGVGFGLQNIINNFMSGLILLYERPIQVGDTVEVKTLVGEVKRIGLRSSSVRTWQGAEVILPNASLISEQVVNWTLSDRSRRIDLQLSVADTVDPTQVLAQLEQIGRSHPDVMEEPEPTALFQGLGPNALVFELRVWTTQFDRYARIRTELALAVHQALHNVVVAMPAPPPESTLDSKAGAT